MRALRRVGVLASLIVMAIASVARAQPQRLNNAKELYQKATRHYELGEYDRAIEEYKRAYEISAAPALLFNLGQVYRLKKDPVLAVRFYTNYLRLQPNASNRADVEALIVEMRAAIEAQEKERAAKKAPPPSPPPPQPVAPAPRPATVTTTTPAPRPATVTPPTTTTPTPPATARGKHWRAELWSAGALAAVGVGATIAGITLGVQANSDVADIQRAAAMGNQTWTVTRQNQYRDGQRYATAATALDVIGPVLIVGGAIVGVLAARDHRVARRFALSPSGQGVQCAF
jgi:tetratricopeptide (TPR) repeat protein